MVDPILPGPTSLDAEAHARAETERKKAGRKRAKRASADLGKQSSLRLRTAEDIANEQTAEQLALRIWAAMVAQKILSGMSALMDELIESHLLDDDDEEADEGWLDEHQKREKRFLDEAISDGLDKYPDFARSTICRSTPILTLPETPSS